MIVSMADTKLLRSLVTGFTLQCGLRGTLSEISSPQLNLHAEVFKGTAMGDNENLDFRR